MMVMIACWYCQWILIKKFAYFIFKYKKLLIISYEQLLFLFSADFQMNKKRYTKAVDKRQS